MPSRRILTVSLLITGIAGYLYFAEHLEFFMWILIPGVLATVCAYVFQHQINWWWYQRYPPGLPEEMEAMYAHQEFFASLSEKEKTRFRTRARLFVEAKEFIAQGVDTVAEDIKYMVAYYAVMVTLGRMDYLFKHYGRVVIYLHPFLSPNYPDTVHTYEAEHEDGTIILSLEQLTAGFLKPRQYYQTGLHVFAELLTADTAGAIVGSEEETWQQLAQVSGYAREQIENYTGMRQAHPAPVLVHHWLTFQGRMAQQAPALCDTARQWLGGHGDTKSV